MIAPLPPELWEIIIAVLREDMYFVTEYGLSVIQSCLRSLCSTSRQLHSIASQHLYAVPMTSRPHLLVRTLAENPALAFLVKSLGCMPWTPSAWPRRLIYLSPKFARIAREYIARLVQLERSEQPRIYGYVTLDDGDRIPDFDIEDGDMPWNKEIFEAVAIGLLPNLTDVLFKNGLKPILPGMPLDSLPHLVSATVEFHWTTTSIRRLPPRPLSRLALIAPNLRSLALIDKLNCGRSILNDKFWVRRVGNEVAAPTSLPHAPAPLFPCVTQLCLKDFDFEESHLPFMLHAFPALESLHVEVVPGLGTRYHCSTQTIQAALLRHAPGLRKLLVGAPYLLSDMDCYHHGVMRSMAWSPELAGLKKLQVLDTSIKLIRRHIDRGIDPRSLRSADWLVRIMPSSLEVLAVRDCDCIQTLVPALRVLAEAVRLRAFPVFKRLVFPGGVRFETKLVASFDALEKQGVEVVRHARLESCSAPGKHLSCDRYCGPLLWV